MTVLFSNPPWMDYSDPKAPRCGIRAGSRWPHTIPMPYAPGEFQPALKYLPYPFFLGYAATYAEKHTTDTEILFRDSIARHETYSQFYTYLLTKKPDLIFIECATPSWEHDRELIGKICELLPSIRIAVTGTIGSVRGLDVLQVPGVVACIKGEYEKNAVKVIQGAEGVVEHDLLTEAEMNASPFPWYDQATARKYWDCNPRGMIYPHAQLWSSRGCMYKCNFCVWPAVMTGNDPDGLHARKVRFYSKDYLAAMLHELVGKYGFRSIYWDDDTANLSDRHTLELCEVMGRANLPWSAMCRADTSSREVWKEMKASGCYGVKIGFETGSQRVMDQIINKKLDVKEAEETGKFLTSIGMSWHGTFMTGTPGSTAAEDGETHALIKRCLDHGMQSYQLSGMAVHDGTPADTLVRSGGQAMKAYPGAKLDERFVNMSDGNKKAEAMR